MVEVATATVAPGAAATATVASAAVARATGALEAAEKGRAAAGLDLEATTVVEAAAHTRTRTQLRQRLVRCEFGHGVCLGRTA